MNKEPLGLPKKQPELSTSEIEAQNEEKQIELDRLELEQLRNEKKEREAKDAANAIAAANLADTVTIDLGGIGGTRKPSINIAGRDYEHGKTYKVDTATKWTIEEQMNRLRAHEASTRESENKGRQKRRAYV